MEQAIPVGKREEARVLSSLLRRRCGNARSSKRRPFTLPLWERDLCKREAKYTHTERALSTYKIHAYTRVGDTGGFLRVVGCGAPLRIGGELTFSRERGFRKAGPDAGSRTLLLVA